ncbi:Holliday junction DNA helicase RuvA [Bacillus sp. JCM 19046]|nr:Holliday junction DNA helicase RuvA [Bacillus sp. JCM 19045]GAF19436.1 Holliday junction DNA helicase RuvA [Bacillus sp. JCM 19046]
MIDYIKGTLIEIEPAYLVVDVNGIGYQLICANPYRFSTDLSLEVQIPTYHYVREDIQRLYGFKNKIERTLFEKLLGVSGIGPKGALAILASGEPEQVVSAIEAENDSLLTRYPGIGKKTARQIILDLKGKLEELSPSLLNPTNPTVEIDKKDNLQDALEALRSLGMWKKS